jgi:hypothetical protein
MPRRRHRGIRIAAVLIVFIALGFVVYLLFFDINTSLNPSLGFPAVGQNWAGYVAASNLFFPQPTVTGVSASWIVPSVQDTTTNTYSSVWAGIGGQFDQTLIQAGTEQDFVDGSPKYYAWYEMLPNYLVVIDSIQVSAGDQIQTSISLVDSASSTWSISVSDQTTGQSFQKDFVYSASKLTAEWIVERPSINGAIADLAKFDTVTFTNCQATISDRTGSITGFSHNIVFMQPIIRNDQSIQLVNISALADGGKQFSVNYIG